jgi:LysM repeat protein
MCSCCSARLSRRAAILLAVGGTFFPGSSSRADDTYRVRKGDTLTGLAQRHGLTAAELAEHNGLGPKDRLRVGQILAIPEHARLRPPDTQRASALAPSVSRTLARTAVQPGRWQYIVVHHSGTRMGTVKGMDRYHREQRHMENGLAYHFVIGNGNGMSDGEVAVGHRWLEQLDGGHLRSEELNQISVGICLVGDFERDDPTARQMENLKALTRYLLGRCKLGGLSLRTHQQINPIYTRCPGRNFPTKTFLSEFRVKR